MKEREGKWGMVRWEEISGRREELLADEGKETDKASEEAPLHSLSAVSLHPVPKTMVSFPIFCSSLSIDASPS